MLQDFGLKLGSLTQIALESLSLDLLHSLHADVRVIFRAHRWVISLLLSFWIFKVWWLAICCSVWGSNYSSQVRGCNIRVSFLVHTVDWPLDALQRRWMLLVGMTVEILLRGLARVTMLVRNRLNDTLLVLFLKLCDDLVYRCTIHKRWIVVHRLLRLRCQVRALDAGLWSLRTSHRLLICLRHDKPHPAHPGVRLILLRLLAIHAHLSIVCITVMVICDEVLAVNRAKSTPTGHLIVIWMLLIQSYELLLLSRILLSVCGH